MLLSDGFQESCCYQASRCLFQSRARMSRALNIFCHAGRILALVLRYRSSMSCQSCRLIWRSCSNPLHIHQQYGREGTHAGVSQWPLWENHPIPSFHRRQKVRSMRSVSFAMLKAETAWVWQTPQTLCWEDCFAAAVWCVTASRNPVVTGHHVACYSPGQAWAEHWTIVAMLEQYKHLCYGTVVQCLASLANWWGIRAAIQFMSITRAEEREHVQVSASDHWFSSQFLSLPKFRSMKRVSFAILKAETAWIWQTPQTFCQENFMVADAAVWCLPGILYLSLFIKNQVAWYGSGQEWAEHWTTFAVLEQQALVLVQCLASLANWWGVRAAIHFILITSTEERAQMQVSASDHCERTILFAVQINEECLLRNVESWHSLSLADTADRVWGRALVADAAVWRLPGIPYFLQEAQSLYRFPARMSRA